MLGGYEETEEAIVVPTERVVASLAHVAASARRERTSPLRRLVTPSDVCLNVLALARSFADLSHTLGRAHGALAPESVFIGADGWWRVGCWELSHPLPPGTRRTRSVAPGHWPGADACPTADAPSLAYALLRPDTRFTAPELLAAAGEGEEGEAGGGGAGPCIGAVSDVFSLGALSLFLLDALGPASPADMASRHARACAVEGGPPLHALAACARHGDAGAVGDGLPWDTPRPLRRALAAMFEADCEKRPLFAHVASALAADLDAGTDAGATTAALDAVQRLAARGGGGGAGGGDNEGWTPHCRHLALHLHPSTACRLLLRPIVLAGGMQARVEAHTDGMRHPAEARASARRQPPAGVRHPSAIPPRAGPATSATASHRRRASSAAKAPSSGTVSVFALAGENEQESEEGTSHRDGAPSPARDSGNRDRSARSRRESASLLDVSTEGGLFGGGGPGQEEHGTRPVRSVPRPVPRGAGGGGLGPYRHDDVGRSPARPPRAQPGSGEGGEAGEVEEAVEEEDSLHALPPSLRALLTPPTPPPTPPASTHPALVRAAVEVGEHVTEAQWRSHVEPLLALVFQPHAPPGLVRAALACVPAAVADAPAHVAAKYVAPFLRGVVECGVSDLQECALEALPDTLLSQRASLVAEEVLPGIVHVLRRAMHLSTRAAAVRTAQRLRPALSASASATLARAVVAALADFAVRAAASRRQPRTPGAGLGSSCLTPLPLARRCVCPCVCVCVERRSRS